ncbi:MAG TPA: Ger(x)C family spore germination protein [Candidatus Paenibacillus intestinavium]|nr:Ger(x)C family spore germination protein [Candidatus Paenibacillus intestinavium]
MYFLKSTLLLKVIIICTLILPLTGCWNSVNIEDQLYVSALGVDYKDEEITVYAQVLDFNNLSRSEGGSRLAPEQSTFVGKGRGKTINQAVFDLYRTAQAHVEWGHMGAVVIDVKAMEALGPAIVERIYRSPSTRYNTWLYVTETPIDQILATTSFFDMTSLFSILHHPQNNYRQNSTFPPMLMFKFIVDSNEHDRTIYIPCIGIDNSQWSNSENPLELLTITGAYFESHADHKRLFSRKQLTGIQWLDESFKRISMTVEDEEVIYANLTIFQSHIKIKPSIQKGQIKFNITASYQASMPEYIEEIAYEELVKLAEDKIEKEILNIYKLSLENELDLYSLMHHFRLKYPKQWISMTDRGQEFILNENSIESLKVNINISSNGKYKREIQ